MLWLRTPVPGPFLRGRGAGKLDAHSMQVCREAEQAVPRTGTGVERESSGFLLHRKLPILMATLKVQRRWGLPKDHTRDELDGILCQLCRSPLTEPSEGLLGTGLALRNG